MLLYLRTQPKSITSLFSPGKLKNDKTCKPNTIRKRVKDGHDRNYMLTT